MEHSLKTIYVIFENILLIILVMEVIIGNLGNGFIALVNSIDWVKKKKISLVNQILTALATSRIFLLWLLSTSLLISFLYPQSTNSSSMIKCLNNAWIIANHFSIWIATCLSLFYFFKISNFSNSLFFYLKWRLKKSISVTMVGSLVLLFLNILLFNLEIDVCIDKYERNTSYSFSSHYHAKCSRYTLGLHAVFLSVPFAVTLSTFHLLIFSLWTHHKKMQQHVQGCRDTGTTAHIKALQSVTAFILLFTIFILCLLVQFWNYELLEKSIFILFFEVVYIAFPSFHSCILILGDRKLRQASLSLLLWLKCRCNYMATLYF